ncbi:molybdopterin-binding protein [Streptomyces sp. NPDC059524]|uniref:molybdopterin-binding protein n=1 Tax=Streptomyces sp. NPDC059524 TaxID=3346856 RepID=UPI0036CF431D
MTAPDGRSVSQADPIDGDVDEALALANAHSAPRGQGVPGAPRAAAPGPADAGRDAPRAPRDPRPGTEAPATGQDVPRETARDRHHATPWPAARRIAAQAGRQAAAYRARTTEPPVDPVTGAQTDPATGLSVDPVADASTAPRAERFPRGAARVPLEAALGLVLAAPLTALTDLPSFDTSAMDGWVVAGPGPWAVRDEGILAGHEPPAPLSDGEAAAIATGARIPPETTAVIRSEHGRLDDKRNLHPLREVAHGQDIRPRAQECRSGELLLPAGSVVTPAVLGLAAAAGYDDLLVVPRARVEVLVLGDELLTSGRPRDGLIRDALGPMLPHWLRALGVEVIAVRRLGDDAGAVLKAVRDSTADLVVTTGGTASGPVDHVHPTLRALGAELLVDGVKVRPGHPMLLARLAEGRHLVGLPGNPLAAVSGLLTLAEPLLSELSGRAAPESSYGREAREPDTAPLHAAVQGHPHDTRLVPVVLRQDRDSGHDWAVPLHYNGPAMLRGIAAADALAVIPPGGAQGAQEVGILDLPWSWSTGNPGTDLPGNEGCFT